MRASLKPHEQRVVYEYGALVEKVTALGAFFYRPMFAELPQAEQNRLHRQYRAMIEYSAVLVECIDAFPT